MNVVARYAFGPLIAAMALIIADFGWALFVGSTHLDAEATGVLIAITGITGSFFWLMGVVLTICARGIWRSWAWATPESSNLEKHRRLAWILFGLIALTVLVLGVKGAGLKFARAFRKPVYQALASGLTAAAITAGLAAISVPLVAILERVLGFVLRFLPDWANPGRIRGGLIWLTVLAGLGAVCAPLVVSELHTVDLRPARMVLVWLMVLCWLAHIVRVQSTRLLASAAFGVIALVACLGWTAVSVGQSQNRLMALDRDTILTGPLLRRINRLGDGDRDGVPRLFSGGDCDDGNPDIRPGVYDPPADGLDQNCTGADLDLASDPIVRPKRNRPAAIEKPMNVLLLTIDALRYDVITGAACPDRVQCADLMPALGAFAGENVAFTEAYSHGAATYWSLPALMQSTMPSRLHMGRDQTPVSSELLLTEVLRDRGWHTALFANVTVFFVRGLRQGAQVANYDTSKFTVHGAKPGSAHMTDGVLAHIDTFQAGKLRPARDKFFVWAHYYDPHDPYFEVPGFPAKDDSDRSRYDAIVRSVDQELNRLFKGLKSRGLWDSTLIILTADHGDEFEDHGHRFHGSTLYEEMTHVPLLMRVPGIEPRRLNTPIGHMEVAPTVLELLGEVVPQRYLGRSRADEVRTGESASIEDVFFEVFPDSNYAGHQVGMRAGHLKLIYRLSENYFELYDLKSDPGERRNLYDEHAESKVLTQRLLRYVDHHLYALARGKSGAKRPPGSPDPGARKKKKRRKKKTR